MKVVVDANRIFSALLRDGPTRQQIFTTDKHLVAPGFLREEVRKHRRMLQDRSGLTPEGIDSLTELLFQRITWIPDAAITPHLPAEQEALGHIDAKDVAYLACALAVKADAIWSHDRDGQDLVPRIASP